MVSYHLKATAEIMLKSFLIFKTKSTSFISLERSDQGCRIYDFQNLLATDAACNLVLDEVVHELEAHHEHEQNATKQSNANLKFNFFLHLSNRIAALAQSLKYHFECCKMQNVLYFNRNKTRSNVFLFTLNMFPRLVLIELKLTNRYLCQIWARYLDGGNISTKIESSRVKIEIGEASSTF